MTIEAKARIVIVGGPQALKTVQGVSRETAKAGATSKRAATEQARAAKQTANEQIKEAKRASKEIEREEAKKLRAIEKQHAMAAKAIGAFARGITQEAKREAAKQLKIEEQTQRTRIATRRRYAKGFVTGATAGVIAGGLSAMSTARGVAGVDDARTRVQKANDFRERLIITAAQAGVNGQGRERIQSQVMDAAMQSGTDPGQIMAALELAQKQFNGLERFAGIIGNLATTAKASGSDIQDLTSALGFAQQAFGLTDEQAREAMDLMVGASAKGSIELADFARDFASSMGVFAEGTGQKGMEGFKQFLGTAQAGGTLGAGSAETATMMNRFVSDLADTDVQKKLNRIGVKTKGKSTAEIIDQLSTNKKFEKPEVQQQIFQEQISGRMVTALVSARRRRAAGDDKAVDIDSIASMNATEGSDLTKATLGEMESSGLLDLQRQAVSMQNDTITNLKTYNDQIMAVTTASVKLEKSLGSLSLWADSFSMGGGVGAGAGLLTTLASSAGGGAAAGGAAAAGGGVLAGGMLAAGAGVLGAAAGGYGLGMMIDKWTGASEKFADALTAAFSDYNENKERVNRGAVDPTKLDRSAPAASPAAAAQSAQATNSSLVNETREQTRQIKRLAEALERRAPPPNNNSVRGN